MASLRAWERDRVEIRNCGRDDLLVCALDTSLKCEGMDIAKMIRESCLGTPTLFMGRTFVGIPA
jgi:hypothetical protein